MLNRLGLIAFVIGALSGSSAAWAAQGYLYETKGNVKAAVGTEKPQDVKKDQHLSDNTTITVGPQSSATLKFEDGTVILLNENTSFQIQKYAYNDKDPSKISALFSMLKGGMRAVTGLISSKNREAFKVATPVATIGIRGTEFMAQIVNSQVYMQVLAGAVSLANAGGAVAFSAGQTASVTSQTAAPRSVPAAPAGTFGNMPAAKLPAAVPAPVPPAPKAAAAPAAKPAAPAVKASLDQVKEALKAPGDLATKIATQADQGVSASVIVAAVAEVAGKEAAVAAIPILVAKGADAAAVTTAAIAAGAPAAAVQSAAIGAGADPSAVTAAAAAGAPAAPAQGAPAFTGTTPSGAPVPGGGGGGAPVSRS